jgi:hypothetical protein
MVARSPDEPLKEAPGAAQTQDALLDRWGYWALLSLCGLSFLTLLLPWFRYEEGTYIRLTAMLWEAGWPGAFIFTPLLFLTLLFGLYVAGRAPAIGLGRLPVSDGFIGCVLAAPMVVLALPTLGGFDDPESGTELPASPVAYFALLVILSLLLFSYWIITIDQSGAPLIRRGWVNPPGSDASPRVPDAAASGDLLTEPDGVVTLGGYSLPGHLVRGDERSQAMAVDAFNTLAAIQPSSASPTWFIDPLNSEMERLWDGSAWSTMVRPVRATP